MPVFVVNDWGDARGSSPEGGGLFDRMIDAAGGRPLPGKWGLAQALVTCWGQPRHSVHPVLHWGKAALNTAGIVRDFRRANDPTASEAYRDPVAEWFKAASMAVPERLERLGSMVLAYSKGLPTEEVRPAKADANEFIRLFTMPNGIRYGFHIWAGGDAREYNHGPYVAKHEHAGFLDTISDVIWSAEGNADLQLTTAKSTGAPAFQLSNIGEPGDYVNDDDSPWRSLDRTAERCLAFRARGVSRNILFYGPPGTGKTTLARSIARRIGQGRTLRVEAQAVRDAGVGAVLGFLVVLKPSVVLFDDMDRCMEHIVELLHYMERGEALNGAVIVGTINVVSAVDPALLRPGRFDEVVEIAEPDDAHRTRIVAHYLDRYGLSADTVTVHRLAGAMQGFAPADVREVVQCVAAIGMEHADAEIARVQRQRVLYAGDACERYALRSTSPANVPMAKGWK